MHLLERLIRCANSYLTVSFKKAKLVVPTEPLLWPKDRAELVGVNSFGVGGANAHVSGIYTIILLERILIF